MADFQHRHYAHVAGLLAQFVHTSNEYTKDEVLVMLRRSFADMFAKDNDRFDRGRFEDAATGNPTNKDRATARRRMGFEGGAR